MTLKLIFLLAATQNCPVLSNTCLYYHFTPYDFSPTNISRWYFTGVWVTASHLRSAGFLSEFWPILTMLFSGWSRFSLWFSIPSVSLPCSEVLCLVHQLLLVSSSPLCSAVALALWQDSSIYLYFLFLSFTFCDSLEQ